MNKLTVLYRHHDKSTGNAKVVNGVLFQDRIVIFKQYLRRILANDNGKVEFAKYYQANYSYFIKFCSESKNLELLQNVKKTNKISNSYYFLMRNYLLTFSKNNFKSRLLRSFYYRLLMRQE